MAKQKLDKNHPAVAQFSANLKRSMEERDKSQDWANKSDEEKAAIRAANIAYNERIAAMTPREYLEDKIARFESRLAITTNEALASVFRVDIEVSRQELARLKK